MLLPGFGFRHFGANVKREKRGGRTGREHGTPADGRKQEARGNGRQQVSASVTGLQNSAQNATPAYGRNFHHEGGADTPFSAHANSEERTHNEEKRVVGGKAAEHLNERKIEN